MIVSADDGSRSARIVLVGEAYGRWEMIYSRPFTGPSYNDRLLPWWTEVGLERADFFITNAWDRGQPPYTIDRIPEAEMRAAFDRLHERIAALDDPWLIVPTGNYALYALTGCGRVNFHSRDGQWERPGITDWRGSILQYTDRRGRNIKVIPTLHPALTFRPGSTWWEMVCRMDWARIAEDAKFRELRLPQRTHMIAPSKGEAIEWLRWTRAQAKAHAHGRPLFERLACSLDVETPKRAEYEVRQEETKSKAAKCASCGHAKAKHKLPTEHPCAGDRKVPVCACTGYAAPLSKPRRVKISEEAYLGCIGYAWRWDLSMTIPTTLDYWQDPAVWAEVKAAMRDFHADHNIDFGGQNFTFDAWWCAEESMPIRNAAWDLMKMHRVQRPAWMKHDLATQASIDTREAFWKHESKLPDEISRWSHNKEQLWRYNGKDNGVQIELLGKRLAALQELGRFDYWRELESSVDAPLLELSRRGLRVDVEGMKVERVRVLAEAVTVAEQLNVAAKCKLIGETGISTKRLAAWLYADGIVTPVWERPLVAVETESARCTTCGHPKRFHWADAAELPCTKAAAKKDGGAPCGCVKFLAPTKLGKRVKVRETTSGGLRLPAQYTKTKKDGRVVKAVSTNIVSIKRLMEQYPALTQLQSVGALVLKHRRLMKVAGVLGESHVSANARWFAMFKQDTLLGRLSSSETPKGDGSNLQNIDRKLRRFFLADTGDEQETS